MLCLYRCVLRNLHVCGWWEPGRLENGIHLRCRAMNPPSLPLPLSVVQGVFGEQTVSLQMEAGWHRIRVVWWNGQGEGQVGLSWTGPGVTTKTLIPSTSLMPINV
jgi:hypothetical protein